MCVCPICVSVPCLCVCPIGVCVCPIGVCVCPMYVCLSHVCVSVPYVIFIHTTTFIPPTSEGRAKGRRRRPICEYLHDYCYKMKQKMFDIELSIAGNADNSYHDRARHQNKK